jgi:hypothetical protein
MKRCCDGQQGWHSIRSEVGCMSPICTTTAFRPESSRNITLATFLTVPNYCVYLFV